jgi:hypothetical protein
VIPADGEDDDEPVHITDGEITIERDQSCFRNLTWRVDIARVDPTRLRAALATAMEDQTRDERLLVFRSPAGHHVLVVAVTGRIQLRLVHDSDSDARPALALALARLVIELADQAR